MLYSVSFDATKVLIEKERNASGTLKVGAEVILNHGHWTVTKAIMSRSARILMEGWVRVPQDSF